MRKIFTMIAVIAIGFAGFLPTAKASYAGVLDYTGKITNPGFENDFTGWTIQNGVFADGTTMAPEIATNRKRSGVKSVNFNTQYGAAFVTECRVYQTITGLEPGEYILNAYKCYGRWEAANGIFADGGYGEIKSTGTSSDSYEFVKHTVSFWVDSNGRATIGAYASARRGGSDRPDFYWIDDFELLKVGTTTRQMEYLNRGLVGVKVSGGVFLSWRSLGTDDPDAKFNIYRNGTLVNSSPLSGATNYTDPQGTVSSTYVIKTVVNNIEIETSNSITPWAEQYFPIQLNRPAGGTTPDGVAYTYTPNDCSVGDLNGDGEYEIIVKWDPSNSKDNANSGYTGNVYLDAYKLDGTQLWRIDLGKNIRAGAHYTQFMVYDLDGDGIAEIACKTAPGTIDGAGNFVLMNNDDPYADYRNSSGYILSGPEYLTVFNGTTGAAMSTVAYNPSRGTVSSWGDNYGNRVDRFLAAVAYLDGESPSLVMCRGYYTRSTLAAYDFRDGQLTQRWFYDSGNSNVGAYGEGFHSLSVADVDGDGKDEIIYGSCVINNDGTVLYRTGLGHGDALHLSDLDPDRTGYEIFAVHEDKSSAYGYEYRDAKTGQVLWGAFTGNDVGRGIAADIDANHRGFEMWSSANTNVYNVKGEVISTNRPSYNFRIYWDGDLQDELLDGTKLDKWTGDGTNRMFTFYLHNNAKEINGTKANPCLSADLFGDWREEVIYYNWEDPSQIMIFTTVIPTDYRLYTLMHDPVYRLGVAWQNVGYNQPPHLGFYIGDGLDNIPTPNIYTPQTYVRTVNNSRNTTSIDAVASLYREPEAYLETDGSIMIISPDAEITSVSVYSINGALTAEYRNISENSYSFVPLSSDKLIVLKVVTTKGVSTLKVVAR